MALAVTDSSDVLAGTVEPADDQLIAAYARGDHGAFDELYTRYRQPLYGYLFRHCGDAEQAGELFQDVWLRVIASSRRFERQGRFRSWLFTLAHNRLVDHYRQTERRPGTVAEQETGDDDTVPADRTYDSGQAADALQAALTCLPLEQRQAFFLREEQGFSIRDIAEIQGIDPEAAKSRLRYAYSKLRDALQEHQL
ncbi:MAG: sigma-70 family RNA polymerase sigma factor [Proteobacteria bacterium]|jgi:RNA polymerase sigma factor (sigma-70 family)|nr:sigma-70 family RNA polymerase sigma factor [Pseudomonadota bacterium]